MNGSRIVLVSCVGQKQPVAAPARDLYTSPLFTGMRAFAEREAGRWYILSALHGVLEPQQVIAPYEQTLNTMRVQERQAWAIKVRAQLLGLLPAGASLTVLAGQRYREGVVPFLEERGFAVQVPMAGLTIGRQLRWLNEHNLRD